jgi:glycosyltransferase involved in cell wall biosynthesis
MFADFPREYELLVYNDGSSDATAEVLAPYADALPLTILGGPQHVGYAKAIDALLRTTIGRCRYPRRDAVILMQGDFTDQPEHVPELVKRFGVARTSSSVNRRSMHRFRSRCGSCSGWGTGCHAGSRKSRASAIR